MRLNVFSALAAYAPSENYLTEAFVFVLRFLLEHEPSLGVPILGRLCGLEDCFEGCEPGSIAISTQVSVEAGRPDIEIRVGDHTLVYAEVKQDAPLGQNQLEYYLSRLRASLVENTQLMLLSRSRITALETSLAQSDYHHVCWYHVYEWLSATEPEGPVSAYLIESFLALLEERKMSMKEVSWEYIKGVPALVALTDMLEQAIGEVMPGIKYTRTAGWSWRGFYLSGEYWTGVRYERPLLLVFENDRASPPFTYKRDLDLGEVHFFSLSRGEQFECLVDYLRRAAAGAPKLGGDAELGRHDTAG